MKTILRIAIILAVAAGIAGLTLLAVNAAAAGSAEPAGFTEGQGRPGDGQPHLEGQAPGGPGRGIGRQSGEAGQAPEGFLPGGEASRHGPLASFETIKNIVVVTLVVLAVWLVERLVRRRC
jgi:hypothetical protein